MEKYILPFDRLVNPVDIIQGFFGQYSHFRVSKAADYTFSIDFALPLGTPVIASRSGIVRTIYDMTDYFYEGLDSKTGKNYLPNLVGIAHDDGTFAAYMHLEKGFSKRIGLKEGEHIERGEIIAITGKSGWIGPIPHLHFCAYTVFEAPASINNLSSIFLGLSRTIIQRI